MSDDFVYYFTAVVEAVLLVAIMATGGVASFFICIVAIAVAVWAGMVMHRKIDKLNREARLPAQEQPSRGD